MEGMLKPLVQEGKVVADMPKPNKIRKYVLDQMLARARKRHQPQDGAAVID